MNESLKFAEGGTDRCCDFVNVRLFSCEYRTYSLAEPCWDKLGGLLAWRGTGTRGFAYLISIKPKGVIEV